MICYLQIILILGTPLLYMILESADTLKASTVLTGISQCEHSGQLSKANIWHFIALAKPLEVFVRFVVVQTSPIFPADLHHLSPPPGINIEVIERSGNPLLIHSAGPHRRPSVEHRPKRLIYSPPWWQFIHQLEAIVYIRVASVQADLLAPQRLPINEAILPFPVLEFPSWCVSSI